MAYDGDRGRVVLFGGTYEGIPYDDPWEWDGNTWIEREPPTSPPPRQEHARIQRTPPTSPRGSIGHAMAFDGYRGRVVL